MEISDNTLPLLIALQLWTIPWKGMALWKAVKSNSKRWFIALLIVNTLGLLEIIYLFVVPPRAKIMIGKQKS